MFEHVHCLLSGILYWLLAAHSSWSLHSPSPHSLCSIVLVPFPFDHSLSFPLLAVTVTVKLTDLSTSDYRWDDSAEYPDPSLLELWAGSSGAQSTWSNPEPSHVRGRDGVFVPILPGNDAVNRPVQVAGPNPAAGIAGIPVAAPAMPAPAPPPANNVVPTRGSQPLGRYGNPNKIKFVELLRKGYIHVGDVWRYTHDDGGRQVSIVAVVVAVTRQSIALGRQGSTVADYMPAVENPKDFVIKVSLSEVSECFVY